MNNTILDKNNSKPEPLSSKKNRIMDHMDNIASKRDFFIEKNECYYKDMVKWLKFSIPEGKSVLEVGCGTGYVLNALCPSRGVGIDISAKMLDIAKSKYKDLTFINMDAEYIDLDEKFDYIVISDTLCYLEDIQKSFQEIFKLTHAGTRIFISLHNFLWEPFLKIAEILKIKMPSLKLNWLNQNDIINILLLEGYDIVSQSKRLLVPRYIPFISTFFNRYISQLPFFRNFCITEYVVARPLFPKPDNNKLFSVSVIIPAKNEKGNIEAAIKRTPEMGKHTEIIFVEGHSQDGTLDEIKRVVNEYSDKRDIKFTVQDGTGKGDAVRKGFNMSSGDILMILDADLTVPPETLPKFYNAIATNRGEYINGTRLVYPMEKQAMRTLNLMGNKFFSFMFSWLLGQRLKDTLCGTKVISRENWDQLSKGRSYFGDFDPFGDFDLIFGAAKMNLKILEVPIRYQERKYGETQIQRFVHGWLLLKMTAFAALKIKFI